MDAFLIIVAIICAVALLFRFAAPPYKIKYRRGERLSEKAVMFRMRTLAKRCVSTERGFGIHYRQIKIKKMFNGMRKKMALGKDFTDWENELFGAEQFVCAAFEQSKNAVRHCYALGHIDGVPRIYLFCEQLVRLTDGDISKVRLERAVKEFQNTAAFTSTERELLCDMLRFCLCAYLYGAAYNADKRSDAFFKGYEDGKSGKVNLDGISYVDYVCGLNKSLSDKDAQAVERLLEANGVSLDTANSERKKFLSETCATVRAVLRSLVAVNEYSIDMGTGATARNDRISSRIKIVLEVVPIVLTVVAAVLTCIFVPQRFAAVFFVVAVIAYALFRLPVLLVSPNKSIIDFSVMYKKLLRRDRKKNSFSTVLDRTALSEVAYFGDDVEYAKNVHDTRLLKLITDNRGGVRVRRSYDEPMCEYECAIICEINGKTIGLADFDCILEKHKTVYKYVSPQIELCAEWVASVACSSVLCKIAAINRSNMFVKLNTAVLLLPSERTNRNVNSENAECGAAISNGYGSCAVLSIGKNGQYGGNLRAYDRERALKFGDDIGVSAIGTLSVECAPFEKQERYASLVFGSCCREAERLTDYVRADGYFDYASDSARVYFSDNNVRSNHGVLNSSESFLSADPQFETPKLPKPKYALKCECGGFTDGGEYAIELGKDDPPQPWRNLMVNRSARMELSHDRISKLVLNEAETVSANIAYGQPKGSVFVILGENGLVWSPMKDSIGNGDFIVSHGYGYSEYVCAYNGCISVLKCMLSRDGDRALFDLTVHNEQDRTRNIDVMFSALFDVVEDFSVSNSAIEFVSAGVPLRISASRQIKDSAQFKEGYFKRGKIVCAAGFRSGGATPAPTASVKVKMSPNERARTVFAVSMIDDKIVDLIEYTDNEKLYLKKLLQNFWTVSIQTDDKSFDLAYKRAFYQANYYRAFSESQQWKVREICELCAAIKYVDANFVRTKLLKLAALQSSDGDMGGDEVFFCVAAVDYTEHTQDYGFLDEPVQYRAKKGGQSSYGKMSEHCLRAICAYLRNVGIAGETDSDIVSSAYLYRKLIDTLHYFMPLCKDESRSIFINALNECAAEFESTMSKLARTNYKNDDCKIMFDYSELLFGIGELERAYSVLKFNTSIESCKKAGIEKYGGEPYIFGSMKMDGDTEKDYTKGIVAAARFYTVVTENLFGLAFHGDRIRVRPRFPNVFHKAELYVRTQVGNVKIIIDNTEKEGDWRMKTDKISLALTDIKPEIGNDKTVTLYRDGAK